MGSFLIILLTILNVWLTLVSIFRVYIIKYSINKFNPDDVYEEKVKCTLIVAIFLIVISVIPVIGLSSLCRYAYLYLGPGDKNEVKKIVF